MQFEWDENKNKLNQQKHGVSFEEAKTVFDDSLHLSKLDYRFDYFEERWITIGMTEKRHLLVVANLFFTDEGEEIIRIISARPANQKEKNVEERAKLDEYEMKDQYDFSNGIRGRFYKTEKVKTTLLLDSDILLFLQKQAREQHIDYSLLVNTLLRECMNNFGKQHSELG